MIKVRAFVDMSGHPGQFFGGEYDLPGHIVALGCKEYLERFYSDPGEVVIDNMSMRGNTPHLSVWTQGRADVDTSFQIWTVNDDGEAPIIDAQEDEKLDGFGLPETVLDYYTMDKYFSKVLLRKCINDVASKIGPRGMDVLDV